MRRRRLAPLIAFFVPSDYDVAAIDRGLFDLLTALRLAIASTTPSK